MWNYVISNNTHTLIWRGKVTWDVRSTLEKVVNHLSYGLRFKSFSPNLQCGIAKRTQGNVVYCLTAKKKTNKTKKRKKIQEYPHIHVFLADCTTTFHNICGCTRMHIIQSHDSFTYKARPEKHLPSVQPHKSWMVRTWKSPASLALWLNLLQLNYQQPKSHLCRLYIWQGGWLLQYKWCWRSRSKWQNCCWC